MQKLELTSRVAGQGVLREVAGEGKTCERCAGHSLRSRKHFKTLTRISFRDSCSFFPGWERGDRGADSLSHKGGADGDAGVLFLRTCCSRCPLPVPEAPRSSEGTLQAPAALTYNVLPRGKSPGEVDGFQLGSARRGHPVLNDPNKPAHNSPAPGLSKDLGPREEEGRDPPITQSQC